MEKAIFSITCTTCRARLVVRSEEAIGAILECPRCESMVQVVPPDGWKPSPPPGTDPPADGLSGPPPLDRVAAVPQMLDLGPTNASLLDAVSGQIWLVAGIGLAATLLAVWGLWSLLSSPATPGPATDGARPATEMAHKTNRPATVPSPQTEHAAAVAAPGGESPAVAVAGGDGDRPPRSAVPSPGGDQPKGRESDQPATRSSPPVAPKGAELDPLPLFGDEPQEQPPKDARPAEVKKLAPPQVDAATRLANPLPAIEMTDMRLAAAVDLLAAMTLRRLRLAQRPCRLLGVTPQDPVSVRLSETTVGKALAAVAAQRGLAVAVDGGQVL